MPFFLLVQVVDQLHVVIGQFHELIVYEILLATFTLKYYSRIYFAFFSLLSLIFR